MSVQLIDGHAVPSRTDAVEAFVDVFRDTAGWGIGEHLTCREANALADLFRAHGERDAADALLGEHAVTDEEGDDPEHLALAAQTH